MEDVMKIKNLLGIFLFYLCTISLVSCQKVEFDFDSKETEESTVVEGVVITSGGKPLANVKVKVNFYESKWLSYHNTRHKAETITDINGKYRLFFSVRNDELKTDRDKDLAVNKSYHLIFDMNMKDSEKYILPSDMQGSIISVNPPIGKPAEKVNKRIDYSYASFEREKTYTQNLYIPKKRYIQVTLRKFIPKQGDLFEICSRFPYGGECVANHLFPNTNYGFGEIGGYQFALYDAEEQTYQVPFALNENNIVMFPHKEWNWHNRRTSTICNRRYSRKSDF